jgi:outer membrane lipoprotein-sorting protein
MNSLKKWMLTAIVMLAVPFTLFAQDDLTALKIVEQVYNRATGDDMEGNLTMTLTNSRGEDRVRKIKQLTKDSGKSEKKIMFFQYPTDVRNTSFMTWSYDEAGKDDDQWIYLPALKKVKRISSDSKSDYFMGSDFTYDDLGDRHPTEDVHKLLGEETVEGNDCYKVESTPKDEEYMYSRTITWVTKDKWIALKKEFYDEDDDLLKTLEVKKFENINGFWIILGSRMHNLQKEHTTQMELENVKINSNIADRMFTVRMMQRGIK